MITILFVLAYAIVVAPQVIDPIALATIAAYAIYFVSVAAKMLFAEGHSNRPVVDPRLCECGVLSAVFLLLMAHSAEAVLHAGVLTHAP